jgi:peptidoglycan/LPS O-acetylase OafA/YrhL
MAEGREARIDWLKGGAALSVLIIHARALQDPLLFQQFVNRAVPIFVLLFGVTSELWWRARSSRVTLEASRAWYRTRLPRLLIPAWGALALWLAIEAVRPDSGPMSTRKLIALALGYWPWVGTGWFVTLVLELVVLYPALRLLLDAIGERTTLLVTFVALVLSCLHMADVVAFMRNVAADRSPMEWGDAELFYFLVFPPTWLFLVVCGMVWSRRGRPVGPAWIAASLALVAVGFATRTAGLLDRPFATVLHLALTPAAALIAFQVVGAVRHWAPAARALAWVGAASWGMYLGQLVVYNALVACGVLPEGLSGGLRWAFAAALLVGALALIAVGVRVRALLPARTS